MTTPSGHIHGTDVKVSKDLLAAIGGAPTSSTELVVDAQHVNKWFGKLHVLQDVSLEVKRQ